MELFDSIYKRKSIRKFSQEKLTVKTLDEIKAVIDSESRLYSDIGLQVHMVEEGEKVQKIMRGIVGNFGKVLAPHYLVVTSQTKDGYMENAGFVLEGVVLRLTCMGIATCWLGGHVNDDALRSTFEIQKEQASVVLVAFGHPQDKDSLFRKDPDDAKRKKASEFVTGDMDDVWKKIMDTVRIAPSAANSQPWRFIVDKEAVHVYCAKPANFLLKHLLERINKLDVGIALKHIEIAAKQFTKNVEFKKLPIEQNVEDSYIISIIEG